MSGRNPGNNNGNGNGNPGNGPPNDVPGRGPPDSEEPSDGRGPPEHARELSRRARRTESGEIEVSDETRLGELEERIDWDNLTPLEEWLVARIEELEE